MADTSVTYVGDGAQVNFTVPFPYITNTHVLVTVNETLQLNPLNYVFTNVSTIQFTSAPATNDAIKFQRKTPGDTRLVDFQAGAVLTEADLDLSANQNFYLAQEAKEAYADLVNAEALRIATALGIIETDPDAILAAMVTTMLDEAAAAEIRARVTDIDDNAASILQVEVDMQSQIDTLLSGLAIYVQDEPPVPGVAGIPDPIADGSRWYDSNDSNRPNLWDQATLAWLDLTDPNVGINAAAITVLEVTVDGPAGVVANAAGITVLDVTVVTNADAITANAALHTTLKARVDVTETDIAGNDTDIATNVADITTEQSVRATADSALAVDIALIGAANGGDTAFIIDSNTVQIDSDGTDTLNTILARHAVSIDVNGYVTGYELLNDGTVSAFNMLVDKFQLVHPSTIWVASTAYSVGDFIRPTSPTSPSRVFKCTTAGTSSATEPVTWNTTITGTTADNDVVWTTFDDSALAPFTIQGGSIVMNANVLIAGNLIVTGSITGTQIGTDEVDETHISVADLAGINVDMGSLTAGDITLDATGFVRAGQTAYNTGTGFYLGNDGGTHKFSIGDGGANRMTWDGTTLVVRGNLSVGDYTASDTLMLSADTARTNTGTSLNWTEFKKFEINRPGTVRVTFDGKLASISPDLVTNGKIRTLLDGVVKNTAEFSTTSFVGASFDLTVGDAAVFITIELQDGVRNASEPVDTATSIQNARIKTTKSDGEAVITD